VAGCVCSSLSPVSWRVVPAQVAPIDRRCRRCDRPRPFLSSGRFRVNASGRRLDVWLVYRCSVCEAPFNLALHERVSPGALGSDLDRYHGNDPALAAACAPGAPARVSVAGVGEPPVHVRFSVPRPVAVRLDRLLAERLTTSRREVRRRVTPVQALRRPVRDGLQVVIHDDGCRPHT